MPSITFADASDLAAWSDRREAQQRLPELVRRLVLASPVNPSRVSFRSGEGVQLSGWDGIVESVSGDAFVPHGVSCWELGTGADPKGKADDDYQKRTRDPAGADPKTTTLVFVTSRRWQGARAWVEQRRVEGIWMDVRAYDADDLVTWLECAPAVHAWISSLLGKHPDGVEDLETWWESWSNVTAPSISSEFVLSGRADEAGTMREWLSKPASVSAIRADTVDEAVAFLASVVRGSADDERAQWLARTLVVNNAMSWAQLVRCRAPAVLVPLFSDRDRAPSAVVQGHHVLLVAGKSEPELPGAITLPLRRRKHARAALAQMGVVEGRLDELSSLARGGTGAVRRAIARNPMALIPVWAAAAERRTLLPMLLAGRWNDACEGDREAVTALAARPYEEYREILVRMATAPDPPVRLVGAMWTICAKSDAWALLSQFLTTDDLARFESTALAVLGEGDPKYDLPEGERWMAALRGKAARYSDLLKEGFAETLAVMAGLSDVFTFAGGQPGQSSATRIVRLLLDRTTTWQAWASLGSRTPLLAESAPDVFLDAVDRALREPEPPLRRLFGGEAGPFASMPHTNLIRALETVAWSAEHFARASLQLAKLTAFDDGGNSGNHPSRSLHEIFLTWRPHTSASFTARLHVLDTLRQKEPAAAWDLMASFLGQGRSYSFGTAKPRHRDWVMDPVVTHRDVHSASAAILARLREDVGTAPERWKTLIALLDDIPGADSDAILAQLTALDPVALGRSGRTSIRDSLREFVSRHRSHPDAEWAMPKERVDAVARAYEHFDPADAIERCAWLFGNNPQLLEGPRSNWREHEGALKAQRISSVADLFASGGVDAVIRLAEQVHHPFVVGVALGQGVLATNTEEELLSGNLGSRTRPHRDLACGYLRGRELQLGLEWLEALRTRAAWSSWSSVQQVDYFLILPFAPSTWDLVSAAGADVSREYWQQAGILGRGDVPAADRDHAAREFLNYGRAGVAVQFLALYENKEPRSPSELAFHALEALVDDSHSSPPSRPSAHDIGALLDVIERDPSRDEARVAKLEWLFLPVLEHTRPARVLHATLSNDPSFFVDLVCLVYKPRNAAVPAEPTKEQQVRAQLAQGLLHEWQRLPGLQGDGTIDPEALCAWTDRARTLAATADRAIVADLELGGVLAYSPAGGDGFWPHEAVRDLIEWVASEQLESGIRTGVYNNRGVTTREVGEGGRQERDLVAKYQGHAAALADRWPRTARLLREIADTYKSEAGREDLQAEFEEELFR